MVADGVTLKVSLPGPPRTRTASMSESKLIGKSVGVPATPSLSTMTLVPVTSMMSPAVVAWTMSVSPLPEVPSVIVNVPVVETRRTSAMRRQSG